MSTDPEAEYVSEEGTVERAPPVEATLAVPDVPKKFDRAAIRNAVLDTKGESEIVEAFGVKIEVRTPAIESLLQYRDWQNDNSIMARAFINNCYVPDTGEKVFEETDVDVIMSLPYNSDFKKLQTAINKILGSDTSVVKGVDAQTKSPEE